MIGKGGLTIKQIQRDNDVQIKISQDQKNEWVDVIITGSDEQAIMNTFNHIQNIIGNIKEKNPSFQTNSFLRSGKIFHISTE